jgi:hypothetical protein
LAAGLIARRAGTWRTAENLKNRVRTLFGLFSIASEPEGPKNLTAYGGGNGDGETGTDGMFPLGRAGLLLAPCASWLALLA